MQAAAPNQAVPVSAFSDNYIWLVPLAGKDAPQSAPRVAIVDPGDARPVLAALHRHALTPAAILVTHHHPDHVGGIRGLLDRYPVPVYGPSRGRIPGLDNPVNAGDVVSLESLRLEVLAVPGHTLDHIAYFGSGMLFCGDTLFAGGCGRLFEGTAQQMYGSLHQLAALPDDTRVYCAHEYTLSNLRFASRVEPGNRDVLERLRDTERLRAAGLPTLPSTLGEEKRSNPFLRCNVTDVKAAAERFCDRPLVDEVEVFAAIRRWKDTF